LSTIWVIVYVIGQKEKKKMIVPWLLLLFGNIMMIVFDITVIIEVYEYIFQEISIVSYILSILLLFIFYKENHKKVSLYIVLGINLVIFAISIYFLLYPSITYALENPFPFRETVDIYLLIILFMLSTISLMKFVKMWDRLPLVLFSLAFILMSTGITIVKALYLRANVAMTIINIDIFSILAIVRAILLSFSTYLLVLAPIAAEYRYRNQLKLEKQVLNL